MSSPKVKNSLNKYPLNNNSVLPYRPQSTYVAGEINPVKKEASDPDFISFFAPMMNVLLQRYVFSYSIVFIISE
jgi:hypothetical protein